ncbi:hypothetical protein [Microbacterium immunditiarum]|uniref:Agglutinin receptor n=1 Tax=Microbacterium immunditiarum TaxID=337480 RepID=A0A7Y9GMH9_9MICO|nr:hypothetical protein [Microbacterium immunditiarum]NYE19228.1 hypothetical protein [Microbacterium immunditiarum]
MAVPEPSEPHEATDTTRNPLLRAAIWVAIGALVAAAIVCVVWVLIGSQNGIVGRAFLTILLLAAFAGVAILDAHLAPRRPAWFALASMGSWVAALLIGAVLIWMPERYALGTFTRFFQFLVVVLILQLLLLHIRLYVKAYQRYVTAFTRVVAIITLALVVALAVMLILPIVLNEWLEFPELYWRIVVAITILAAVGTALIPLVNALFAPKKPRMPRGVQQPIAGYAPAPWPTYADGVTPLPVMPDGTPDWNAYYTGYPTVQPYPTEQYAPEQYAPELPQPPVPPAGYEGYPPPPPLPPRP